MRKLLKTLIVDDEKIHRELFKSSLRVFINNNSDFDFDLYESHSYNDVETKIKAGHYYDFSILDISLDKNRNIFELLSQYGSNPFGVIAFTSQHKQDLNKFLELDIKPTIIKKIFSPSGISKYFTEHRDKFFIYTPYYIVTTINNTTRTRIPTENILYATTSGVAKNMSKIVYIENDKVAEITEYKPLSKLLEDLKNDDFMFSNRFFVVNTKNIKSCISSQLQILFGYGTSDIVQYSKENNTIISCLKEKGLLS